MSPPVVLQSEPWEEAVDRAVAELEPRIVATRRHLHAHPEPSGAEKETTAYLAGLLDDAGMRVHICRDGLGVVADLDVGPPAADAPCIAIRADIDALRIQDAKSTSYASQNPGLCHACGHDAHSAIVYGSALTTAQLLQNGDLADEFPSARLRFIFQPAEESGEGARWLVEQGVVDGVRAIVAAHVDPERELGTVGIRYGTLTANCDEVEIVVEGRGGHSARPHHTRDPIAAAAQVVTTLYGFLPRSVDSRQPSVFSVGAIRGGELPNVIPDRVEILGSLRTLDTATRDRLKDRIEAIVHGVKEASETSIHVRFYEPLDAVVNDARVTTALEASAVRVLGAGHVHRIHEASMGGEDFSAYLSRAPGAMLRLGCAPPAFKAPFLHAPDFDIDERALGIGARILLRTALRLAVEPWKDDGAPIGHPA